MSALLWLSWVWGLDSVRNSCGFILRDGNLTAYGWTAAMIWILGYAVIGSAWGVVYHWMRASDAAMDGRI
jgi:hypothetical protein